MRYHFILLLALLASCTSESPTGDKSISDKPDKLVWSDEFELPQLDTTRWKVITGNGCPELCGFGNNELQYYTGEEKNLYIENGILKLRALKDSVAGSGYSSAKIISKNKGDWKYGRIEVHAKLPEGRGTWPAIWMLPTLERRSKWPDDGEIDIMEHVGYNQGMIYGAAHTERYNGIYGTQKVDSVSVPDVHEKFHVYSLEWSENQLSWMVDGKPFYIWERGKESHEGWPFTEEFHLILNLAVGGNWGGKYGVDDGIWPQTLEIDYVKIYQ